MRWLARSQAEKRFHIDTFSPRATATQKGNFIAEINGPGVLDYFFGRSLGELQIVADGVIVMRCSPGKEWKQVYVPPKPHEYGELPFAFPLVQQPGPYSQCVVPIPFRERLVVKTSSGDPKIWLSGRRLKSATTVKFSTAAASEYVSQLARIQKSFLKISDRLVPYPDEKLVTVNSSCAVRKTTRIAEATGPAEMVGLRLRFEPAGMELLRHQVVELEIDGVKSVRMPLVDFIGVSHPWPHAWFSRAGTWA
ncbi:MAG: hypothetical protein QF437_14005, partial [Planctomycetota bacterium]|nr:hypothetical protein [Planctomycetota bacterium]